MKQGKRKSGFISQILIAVVIALLVGGSSPWWWKEFFRKPMENNDERIEQIDIELESRVGQLFSKIGRDVDSTNLNGQTNYYQKVKKCLFNFKNAPRDLKGGEIVFHSEYEDLAGRNTISLYRELKDLITDQKERNEIDEAINAIRNDELIPIKDTITESDIAEIVENIEKLLVLSRWN
jgi:hypothetical protein